MTKFNLYLKYISTRVTPIQININESTGITYHELRQLLTMFIKNTGDSQTKKVITELIKIIYIMELKAKPVPNIKKLKNISPQIFGD